MEQVTKSPSQACLTIRLFTPGMSLLHRAGLGGLACTLRAMERYYQAGLLPEDKLPAAFERSSPPWSIDAQSVTLRFGQPEKAGEYLEKLFAFAFQIRDGLIYLPGQYPDPPPSLPVRAELQTALSRTFLQGAKKNVGMESTCPFFVDPDESGSGNIQIEFQRCKWYLHQQVWKAFVDSKSGILLDTPKKKLDGKKNINFGSLYPGAIKRHDVFNESDVSETTQRLMCSLFFLVACMAARLNDSGDGVLLIPDVQNLEFFVTDRPYLTPSTVSEVRVGGSADAAYQAEVRLRSRSLLMASSMLSLRAVRFSLRTWTKPQKSRVNTVDVSGEEVNRVESESPSRSDRAFSQFEVALALLPRGVRITEKKETAAKKKARRTDMKVSSFWTDSIVRPHIATNLAIGRPWYDNFEILFRDKKTTKRVAYETGGLRAMGKNRTLTDEDETQFIAAIHRAIYMGRGRIYAETMGQDAAKRRLPANSATRKRWEKFRERLRLGLVGAKTETQVQDVINDLLARNGTVTELRDREAVHLVRRVIFGEDWKRARNLCLFALASYVRPPKAEALAGDPEDSSEWQFPQIQE